MALINYIEPISGGEIFLGLGGLLLCGTAAYVVLRFYKKSADYFDLLINRDTKYLILEEAMLDKVGKKKGIELDKELIKKNMIHKKERSFRKKLEQDIYEEMFGKTNK